jgi:N-dimethylarginine dimethylaminohydrolase
MKINSHNEWDTLKEVIVGNAEARAGLIFNNSENIKEKDLEKALKLAQEAFPQWLIDEMAEDLEELSDVIKDFGAKVFRPNTNGLHNYFQTPFWSASGCNCYNMRDLHLVVGDKVVESPSQEQHRYFEATGLYDIWHQYFEEGFIWIAGPKPRLNNDYKIKYLDDGNEFTKLSEDEIIFEAANTVRMGRDLLYLVSKSGNYKGGKWLQSVLGDDYVVHCTDKIYKSSHIDSTVLCLKPGVVLLNSYRVNDDNCPDVLNKWDKIYFKDIVTYPEETLKFHKEKREKIHHDLLDMGIENNANDLASEWIGLNFLSLDENTIVVDKRQVPLIKTLESNGFTVVPINFRHSYYVGGIHCSTLDTVRNSKLESYV